MQFEADDELLLYAKKLEGLKLLELGKSIGRLDLVHRKHTKGLIGQLIEKEYFTGSQFRKVKKKINTRYC